MAISSRSIVIAVALALLTGQTLAYPAFWVREREGCLAHPTEPEGKHKAPVKDTKTTFTVTAGGAAVKELCPGSTYDVKITYPEERLSLATVSVGTISSDAECPNRLFVPKEQRAASLSIKWKILCTAAGGPAKLAITSADGSQGAFQDATLTVTVNAKCAAGTCAGAGAALAAATATANATVSASKAAAAAAANATKAATAGATQAASKAAGAAAAAVAAAVPAAANETAAAPAKGSAASRTAGALGAAVAGLAAVALAL